jgi:hypothetical protein
MTPDDLIAERAKTHGDFKVNARVAQAIRYAIRDETAWAELSFAQRETLDHIAGKIGRIVAAGCHGSPDHFRDIGGYARLGELDAQKVNTPEGVAQPRPGDITWVEGYRE